MAEKIHQMKNKQKCTLECQIDHTMGKKLHLENTRDIGTRATEKCNIKAIDIWLSTLENLWFAKCCCYFPDVYFFPHCVVNVELESTYLNFVLDNILAIPYFWLRILAE